MSVIDLANLPPPDAVEQLSFEEAVSTMKDDLAARFPPVAPILQLDSSLLTKLLQVFGYRDTLVRARINDAVLSVLIAFSNGADLDHLGAFYGVGRRLIAPAVDGVPAVLESDSELRRRILLAPESFSVAGPEGAYLFHALKADPRVLNAEVWSPSAGEVSVAIQSREGDGTAPPELVAAVRSHLLRPDIKPLTDVVTVQSIVSHTFAVSIDAYVLPGPDPVLVKTSIEKAILAAAAARRTPSRDMPRSALIAAAQLAVVDRVSLVSPAADIAMGHGEVPVLSGLSVRVHSHE